jgi:WD40 repeat protein
MPEPTIAFLPSLTRSERQRNRGRARFIHKNEIEFIDEYPSFYYFEGNTIPCKKISNNNEYFISTKNGILKKGEMFNRLGTLYKTLDRSNLITFSSDGKFLATASANDDKGIVKLWDVALGQERKSLIFDFVGMYANTPSIDINNLFFSPDGKFLGLVINEIDYGRIAYIWEILSGKEIADIGLLDEGSTNGVFSADRNYLTRQAEKNVIFVQETGGSRKVVRLNLDQHTNLTSVTGIDGKSYSVDILEGKTVIVKEDSSNQEIVRLSHEDTVKDVALSPDGRYLATVSMDGTTQLVRLLSPEQLISEICSRLTRNLSLEEWQQYLPNEPYRKTCPNLPVHPSLTEEGRKLAKEGNIKAAIASFQRVQKLDPNIDLNPETEAIDKDPKAVAELIASEASPD